MDIIKKVKTTNKAKLYIDGVQIQALQKVEMYLIDNEESCEYDLLVIDFEVIDTGNDEVKKIYFRKSDKCFSVLLEMDGTLYKIEKGHFKKPFEITNADAEKQEFVVNKYTMTATSSIDNFKIVDKNTNMKYRKKLVEIEAIQFKRNEFEDINEFTNGKAFNFRTERSMNGKSYCDIKTSVGTITAAEGDYIIKGVDGDFYTCEPDIFEKTYELVK